MVTKRQLVELLQLPDGTIHQTDNVSTGSGKFKWETASAPTSEEVLSFPIRVKAGFWVPNGKMACWSPA